MRQLTWSNIKEDTGLVDLKLDDFFEWRVLGVSLGYYGWGLVLGRVISGEEG
ncbi:uncharacterized protein BDV14DRAFT_168513 [Aspergillus stella-maris]|uniref:uncharacterized protein n=1 Tax=Aspergillus stella-maris TaxID=1810926 RepID=UPI003CCD1F6D